MKILVTGGSGVLGTGTVAELLRREHSIVLLSRHAREDVRQWPSGVVPFPADVSEARAIHGAADGCDLVLHMAGIVDETPPSLSFDRVNVGGTKNVIAEAERAKVGRFVYVSSLGAPTGASGYHRSKRQAEELVRAFDGGWTICRPGNVYGPGDEQISILLRMVRGVSPIVPTIGDGNQPFQPLWWEDGARAIAEVVHRTDIMRRELNLAGDEVTTQNDLIARLSAITGREVHSVAVPEFLASFGAKAASLVGWKISLSDDQLQMLRESNVIPAGATNALTSVLGVEATPLDAGLRALCDLQPEQLPSEGIGSLTRKRYWADIAGSHYTPESLFEYFRANFNAVTPVFVGARPQPASSTLIEDGTTLTLSLPVRGHVQVRAAGLEARQVTLITVTGHPLAGAVRFLAEWRGPAVRFQVEVYDRAANMIDFIAMRAMGGVLQDYTWTQVVEQMVQKSGGSAPQGVQHDEAVLTVEEARLIGRWLEDLTIERKRAENAGL